MKWTITTVKLELATYKTSWTPPGSDWSFLFRHKGVWQIMLEASWGARVWYHPSMTVKANRLHLGSRWRNFMDITQATTNHSYSKNTRWCFWPLYAVLFYGICAAYCTFRTASSSVNGFMILLSLTGVSDAHWYTAAALPSNHLQIHLEHSEGYQQLGRYIEIKYV